MASVNVVYKTLKDLVNKDQQGFVTPDVFNSMAGIAQINIFNRLFDDLKDAHRNARAQFDPGRDKSLFKRINEDLSFFAKTEVIQKDQGVFAKPNDVARIISATTFGDIILDQSTRTPIEMCYDEDKIDRMLRNNISAPTESYPIALVSKDVEVFPQSIQRIRLKYYKFPQSIKADTRTPSSNSPSFGVGIIGTYSPQNSFDFELPDHYISMLVVEIAELIGVNLREQAIADYGNTEKQSNNIQQSFG